MLPPLLPKSGFVPVPANQAAGTLAHVCVEAETSLGGSPNAATSVHYLNKNKTLETNRLWEGRVRYCAPLPLPLSPEYHI